VSTSAGFLSSPADAAPVTPFPLGTVPTSPTNGHAGLYAWGAATMPDGSVILGDYWNGRVVHYAADGTDLGVLFDIAPLGGPVTPNTAPYGLAVDPGTSVVYVGTYYVDPRIPSVVQRWAPDPNTGEYTQQSPISYSGFQYPSRVAVANGGRVFVADMFANKIFVFGRSGTFLFSFASGGTGPGQFNQPRGMGFDQSSPQRLYVADANNKRVEVFNTAGAFLFQFGQSGTSATKLKGNLRGLAVDPAENAVYVVVDADSYVYKFDLSGNFLLKMGGPGGLTQTRCCSTPGGLFSNGGREATVDGNGNLWVADMPNYRVQVFSPAGQFLFAQPSPAQNPPDGAFNAPRGVEVDGSGDVIVADTYNERIEKFDSSATWQWSVGVRGNATGYFLNYPGAVASDPTDGSIAVADTNNNRVKKFDAGGVFLWQAGKNAGGAQGQFFNPAGVAIAPDGNVYVADTKNHRVQVLSGSSGAFLAAFGAASLTSPTGVTVDPPTGNVYVADTGKHAVIVFTASGTRLSQIGGSPTLKRPYDVAVDGTRVFVSDRGLNKFVVFNQSNGSLVGSFGGLGGGTGQFRDPQGIAVGNGKLYVSDVKNDRIQVWCVDSSCST
jgi:tripartite motif-containing protein 71